MQETTRLTGAVNTARRDQILGCEASISQLMAEVDVLRSRKAVMASYLQAQGERGGGGGGEESKHMVCLHVCNCAL